MSRRWLIPLSLLALVLLCADDCDTESKSDREQRIATENITNQAQQQVGMPGIANFTERKIVSQLYALRDQNIVTHTYVMDMTGRLWFLCDSLGYGLPYGVQFTNPHKPLRAASGGAIYGLIDQAEPNGLFMPPTAEGTWVICAGKKSGEFEAVYSEPRIIASPFRLRSAGSWQEESPQASASATGGGR